MSSRLSATFVRELVDTNRFVLRLNGCVNGRLISYVRAVLYPAAWYIFVRVLNAHTQVIHRLGSCRQIPLRHDNRSTLYMQWFTPSTVNSENGHAMACYRGASRKAWCRCVANSRIKTDNTHLQDRRAWNISGSVGLRCALRKWRARKRYGRRTDRKAFALAQYVVSYCTVRYWRVSLIDCLSSQHVELDYTQIAVRSIASTSQFMIAELMISLAWPFNFGMDLFFSFWFNAVWLRKGIQCVYFHRT